MALAAALVLLILLWQGEGGPYATRGVWIIALVVLHTIALTAFWLADTLGVVGQSGLAGYPHLHFIVVAGSTAYPYQGIPVTFRNAEPADVALRTNAVYTVLPY